MKFSVDLATAHWSNKLMKNYLSNNEVIRPWIYNWPSLDTLKQRAEHRPFSSESRSTLVHALKRQYSAITISSATQSNIDALGENHTFTITTGHQICLATGPLYFIYKIVSAIKLAEHFNAAFPHLKAIPVYWMATEDHDAAEISSINAFGNAHTWNHEQTGAVGEFSTNGITDWLQQWASSSYKEILEKAYSMPTLAEATRYLVNELFGEYGVVIIDGNDALLKKSMIDIFQKEVTNHPAYTAVGKQTKELTDAQFEEQIHAREINLFFLEKNKRTRIERTDNGFQLSDQSLKFGDQELLQLIANHPEKFSPNVIMRPVYQEVILPNLAYIGGQGELAYWLQLKGYFDTIQVSFPLLILRDSALILSERTAQKLEKIGLSLADLEKEQHQVVKELIHQSAKVDLVDEKEGLIELFQPVIEKAKLADATLEATAKAELQKQITALENLEKRLFKAVKSREEVKVQQIQKLWEECFPGNGLQERSENFFAIQSQLQESIIPKLMDTFNPLDHTMKILVMS